MMYEMKIIQINLNRSWGAYDLLNQFIIESNVGLCIISEPPLGLKSNNRCFLNKDGLSAILWKPEGSKARNCRILNRGNKFVMCRFGDFCVISCYCSRNVHINVFLCFLDELYALVNRSYDPILIGGDFNAWSVLWDSREANRRGELVERWSATLDLKLLNAGNIPTVLDLRTLL